MTRPEPTLDIRAGGDTPKRTYERMCGGWLVTLAAAPASRCRVESWACDAFDRAFANLQGDPKQAEEWYAIAGQLKAVLQYTAAVHAANESAAAGKASKH